jgi:alkaline phosphatase D
MKLAKLSVAITSSLIFGAVYWTLAHARPIGAPAEQQPITKIAFGSCLHQDRPQPIWNSVGALSPDLFVLLGDNIYGDTEDMDLMRRKYEQLGNNADYAAFRARTPIIATWDDHDMGRNDAGVEYPKKEESKALMMDFFGEPQGSLRRQRPGVYESYVYGPAGRRAQVILLDTRWFRTRLTRGTVTVPGARDGEPPRQVNGYLPNNDPAGTLLGEEQWLWLEEQLRIPADVRIIGTSIQFTSEEHPYEKWSNFPHERQRLIDLLHRTGTYAKTVIISGDRHLGELSCENDLCDITSSGMSHGTATTVREYNRHRVALYDRGNHFGLLTIQWPNFGENAPVRVLTELRDAQGSSTSVSRVIELR